MIKDNGGWKYWLLLLVGAPTVGVLLLAWANYYSIPWFSKQMLLLWVIMCIDRQLYFMWRATSAK